LQLGKHAERDHNSKEKSYVDAIMRSMQSTFDQAPAEQVRPLSMRLGVVEPKRLGVGWEHDLIGEGEMTVAKVIEFYVPDNFRRAVKWVSPERRGKLIQFGAANLRASRVDDGAGDARNPVLDKAVLP
jgi:hypothetical protein